MHCQAVMYGPMVPPNTPLLGFKTLSSRAPGFRVSLTVTPPRFHTHSLSLPPRPNLIKCRFGGERPSSAMG